MGKLRIIILVFFIAVAAFFTASFVYDRLTSDYQAPVITADSDMLEVAVTATDEDLLVGMGATDNLDGDVRNTLVVVSRSKFIEKGRIHVNYAAFDQNRNVGTYTREVVFTDYISPRFHISAPMRYMAGGTGYDYLENVTAYDCIDGDITAQIKISFGKTVVASDYVTQQKVNLQVTNRYGDTALLELTMSMEDYSTYNQPAPSLSDYVVYVQTGEDPNLRSYLNGIWQGGHVKSFEDAGFDPRRDVSILASSLDVNTPGVYTVTFKLASGDGTYYGTATMIVIVEER